MRHATRFGKYVLIVLIALAALIPFYILFLFSMDDPATDFFAGNMLLPDFHLQNFIEAWQTSHIGSAVLNSVIITGGALALLVLTASAAGYAIARFPNKFNTAVLWIFLVCMMIPGIINTVPLYTVMRAIDGISTRWGMILVCATLALPFSVFLYTGFIKSLGRDIEEAAILDGCTWFSAFWRITFRCIKPATSAVIILNGVSIWNNYAQAIFFLPDPRKHTIPLALSVFFQQFAGAKWHLLAAAAIIAVVPIVTAFLVFQKYFMKGITAGAIKG